MKRAMGCVILARWTTATRALSISDAATDATVDLIELTGELQAGQGDDLIAALLDRWLIVQPGCSRENGFCDNERWLELAQQDTSTTPMGCGVGVQGTGTSPSTLVFGLLAILAARGHRRGLAWRRQSERQPR
ncbi:MAG: hypothetical protein PVI30_20380 [Myxococcales bacterium]|jgi:MYXO-CTERM domain-containing protein